MSATNAIYLEYNSIIGEQEEKLKNLHKKVSSYKDKIGTNTNTIALEEEIEKEINTLKEAQRELDNAYSNKNAPSQISPNELDKRQKQIKKLEISISELQKSYNDIKDQKYEFKGPNMDNYQLSEDMKNMSNAELYQQQQLKLKEQDEQLDDIFMDVKKGRILAKEAGKIMDEQNKQLDELQDDMDRLDSKLKRGAKRFENYVAKKSGCCIIVILILELIAGFLFVLLL